MLEDYLPGEATWDGRADRCELRGAPKISQENVDLFEFTIMVAAKFLDDLTGFQERPITFRFGVREDSRDFIKLDVLGTMIVVGTRTQEQPIARILQACVRARQMSMMADNNTFRFVPIIVFGESNDRVFYVESSRQPGTPSAWFIKAAVEFLAKRLAPALAAGHAVDLQKYLQQMEIDGLDPLEMLHFQPLLRSILNAAPEGVHEETRRQIAAELRATYQRTNQ